MTKNTCIQESITFCSSKRARTYFFIELSSVIEKRRIFINPRCIINCFLHCRCITCSNTKIWSVLVNVQWNISYIKHNEAFPSNEIITAYLYSQQVERLHKSLAPKSLGLMKRKDVILNHYYAKSNALKKIIWKLALWPGVLPNIFSIWLSSFQIFFFFNEKCRLLLFA